MPDCVVAKVIHLGSGNDGLGRIEQDALGESTMASVEHPKNGDVVKSRKDGSKGVVFAVDPTRDLLSVRSVDTNEVHCYSTENFKNSWELVPGEVSSPGPGPKPKVMAGCLVALVLAGLVVWGAVSVVSRVFDGPKLTPAEEAGNNAHDYCVKQMQDRAIAAHEDLPTQNELGKACDPAYTAAYNAALNPPHASTMPTAANPAASHPEAASTPTSASASEPTATPDEKHRSLLGNGVPNSDGAIKRRNMAEEVALQYQLSSTKLDVFTLPFNGDYTTPEYLSKTDKRRGDGDNGMLVFWDTGAGIRPIAMGVSVLDTPTGKTLLRMGFRGVAFVSGGQFCYSRITLGEAGKSKCFTAPGEELIGHWQDIGWSYVIVQNNGKCFMDEVHGNGSTFRHELKVVDSANGRKYIDIGSGTGDYFVISKDGSLREYDREGYIRTARRLPE